MRIKEGFRLLINDVKKNAPGLMAVAAYILIFQMAFHTICPMQLFFGLPCPGCGLTRAFILAAGGHFVRAYYMHPFLYGLGFLVLWWGFFRYVVRKKSVLLPYMTGIVFAGMLVFYIYRMIRYYPDTEPMNPLMEGWIKQVVSFIGL